MVLVETCLQQLPRELDPILGNRVEITLDEEAILE